jgi:hypothetical protein
VTALPLYEASLLNRRARSTKAAMEGFRVRVFEIVDAARPCSVRHVYYLAVNDHLIAKDHGTSRKNYQRVLAALNHMREHDEMPWDWIRDDTRWRRGPNLWRNSREALEEYQRLYRRDLWQSQNHYVEVWCESDSLAGVLVDTTSTYGVDLMPCRGQSSKTFAQAAARSWADDPRTIVIIYIGDFDPAGLNIDHSLEERLRRYSADFGVKLIFQRLAVTADQVRVARFVGHDTEQIRESLAKLTNGKPIPPTVFDFFQTCDTTGIPREAVEAEAIPPDDMRTLLRTEIIRWIDPRAWAQEQLIETAERQSLASIIDKLPEVPR